MDREMSQPQVAHVLGVIPDTVTGWELNRHRPTAKMSMRIIRFIGYNPFKTLEVNIGTQLFEARMILGDTQSQVAYALRCDESNLRYIELGVRTPSKRIHAKILSYVEKALGLIGS